MDQKMLKIVVIILAVFCFVALLVAFTYVSKYTSRENEYGKLLKTSAAISKERDSWSQRAASAEKEVERLRERQISIKADLDKASAERDQLQKRVDEILREREDLAQRLEDALTSAAQAQAKPVAQTTVPSSLEDDAYWAGVIKEKANLEIEVANLRDMLSDAKIKADEQAAIQFDLQKLTKEKEDLQMSLENNQRQIDHLSIQLYQEKEDKRGLQKQANLLREENYSLKGRLREIMNDKVALEKKLRDTESKRVELYNRLTQMDQLLQDKLASIYEARETSAAAKKETPPDSTIELSPIVVRSQQEGVKEDASSSVVGGSLAGISDSAITGKIKNVNSENNFVILDIGENQGVRKGAIFSVYRENNQIATIEVIQVRPNVSAADIKEKASGIKVGDIVR